MKMFPKQIPILMLCFSLSSFLFAGQGSAASSNTHGIVRQLRFNNKTKDSVSHLDKSIHVALLNLNSHLLDIDSLEEFKTPELRIDSIISPTPLDIDVVILAKSRQYSYTTLNSALSALRTIVLLI